MIKMQVYYTTINGEKKSKIYSYINPESSDVTIKDFANALFNLSTNTTGDIYKIDTAILLDDDSDDIVTPIVQTQQQVQLVTLNPSSLILTAGVAGSEVTVTRHGDGAISVTNYNPTFFNVDVNGNVITVTALAVATPGSYELIVNVAETDSYYADSSPLMVTVTPNSTTEPTPIVDPE